MNKRAIPHLFTPVLLAVLLAGCAGPDYSRPDISLPTHWPWENVAKPEASTQIPADWWRSFNDPVLNALEEEGLKGNADLIIAAARVAEARAGLTYQDSFLFPSLDVQGSAARAAPSRQTAAGALVGGKPSNDFSIAAVLTYEIDLWGKLRRASESARAQLMASEANRDAVRLAVAADIANSYFNLRALDGQMVVTNETATSRREALDYQQKQYTHGAVDQLTYKQAQAELAAAEAQVPVLQQARTEQENALAILLGRSPADILGKTIDRGAKLKEMPVPATLAVNAPSSLLEQRPDIQAAEQDLVSANADIGVAKAQYFPTISLGALLGLESNKIDNLFKTSARTWQVGGTLAGPLLNMGRTDAGVDAATARKDQALAAYEQTVRKAFGDVANNLSAEKTAATRAEAQQRMAKLRADTVRLANLRYKAGYSNYLEVLDAQRFLYQAQLDSITAMRDRLTASVNLYKALGGGWVSGKETPVPVAATEAAPATPAPATYDAWLGKWNGVEGTYMEITKANGAYNVRIRELDSIRTYTATPMDNGLQFTRGTAPVTIHAGNGKDTGMKWLAGKTTCLVLGKNEGYCRD